MFHSPATHVHTANAVADRDRALERVAQAELNVTVAALSGYFSERAATWVGIRAAPVGMVDPVEHLRAELNVLALSECEILEHRQIPVLKPGVIAGAITALAGCEGAPWGRSENGRTVLKTGAEVEVAVSSALRELSLTTPSASGCQAKPGRRPE